MSVVLVWGSLSLQGQLIQLLERFVKAKQSITSSLQEPGDKPQVKSLSTDTCHILSVALTLHHGGKEAVIRVKLEHRSLDFFILRIELA